MSTSLVKYEEPTVAISKRRQVVIDTELTRIATKHGSVDPELLLDEARNPKNVLHNYFEWNDTAAAEKWRNQTDETPEVLT